MSKFVYVSTEENNIGNDPNADFVINFHQPLEIKPNSEIRVTECRINPKNDVVEINDNNNVLAFSIGSAWALDAGAYGGYYNVKLDNGIYSVDDGDNNNFLNHMMETKMNEAIANNSLFRGGVEVQVNSNGKLKFFLNEMNKNDYYYEVPYGENKEIPDSLLQTIQSYNHQNLPVTGGPPIVPFNLSKSAGIGVTGDTYDYWGVKLEVPDDAEMLYFMSPPLNYLGVNGLDVDVYNPIFVGEFDLSAITQKIKTSINLVGEGNVGCFYPDVYNYEDSSLPYQFNESSFLFDYKDDLDEIQMNQCPIKICFSGNATNNTQANLVIVHQGAKGGEPEIKEFDSVAKAQKITVKISVNNKLTNGKGALKVEMWEQDNTVICTEVFDFENDLTLFNNINESSYKENWVYNDKSIGNMSNMRVAVVGYSYLANTEFPLPIKLGFNYDPQDGKDGFFNEDYQDANALEANSSNTIAPFVVHGDSVFNRLTQYQILINSFTNKANYESGYDVINRIGANCGTSIGINEFGFQGTDDSLSTTGMVLVDIINTNSRENAIFFVSCDDLPLLNYTGNVQTGSLNKFVYAIDFNSGSGSRNNIYTSQPDVEKFNSLTNRQTLRIQNMRIRITNIRGQTVKNLDDHTYIVFEIRENPLIKQENLLRQLVQKTSQRNIAQIQQNQIRPTTSQFQ